MLHALEKQVHWNPTFVITTLRKKMLQKICGKDNK